MIAATFGNTEILKHHKTAFLCSRKVSASAVLKCYDWAIEQREKDNCIINGFHSQIEKDVLHRYYRIYSQICIAISGRVKVLFLGLQG
jgi:hypothetical protein